MSRDELEAATSRHLAHDFAPAQAWLDSGSLHATELHDAVRFETPVPYQQKQGARKWLLYRPPEALPKHPGVGAKLDAAVTQHLRQPADAACMALQEENGWSLDVSACSSLLELKSRLKAAHAEFTQIKVEACLQSWAPLGQLAGDQAACLKDELGTALRAIDAAVRVLSSESTNTAASQVATTTQADEYDALSSSEACSEAGTAARKHAADAYLLALPEERCVAEEAAGGIFVDPVTKERNLLISPYTEAEKAARRRAAVDEASEGEGEAAETMEEEEEEQEGEGEAGSGRLCITTASASSTAPRFRRAKPDTHCD